MPKFRKKPVVIEAIQWDGTEEGAIDVLSWAQAFEPDRDVSMFTVVNSEDTLLGVHTLEGDMHASPGDWIIRGVQGELYPCKPDIFDETYEEVKPEFVGQHVGPTHG